MLGRWQIIYVCVNFVPDGYCFLLCIGTRIGSEIPEIPDGYGYGDRFCKPDGYGAGMGTIFENGYGCGYGSTRPTPIPNHKVMHIAHSFHVLDVNAPT